VSQECNFHMISLFIFNQAITLLTKRLENCVLTHAGYAKHAQVRCTLRVIGDGEGGSDGVVRSGRWVL